MTPSVPTCGVLRRCAAEIIGTFLLVLLGPGASMVAARTHAFGHEGVALAFGLAVLLIVAATASIGGAHVNPAITFGAWSMGKLRALESVFYIAGQCLGAVAASLLLGWLLGPAGDFGVTRPALPLPQSFVVEALFSAILGFVIASMATANGSVSILAPVVIGATVWVGALVAGPLTGGSFNPARSLGPAVASGIWTAHWIYWAAPIAGMVTGMHAREFGWTVTRTGR